MWELLIFILPTYYCMKLLSNDNKKLSIIGTIILCISSYAVSGNLTFIASLAELIIIALDKFMNSEKLNIKVVSMVVIGLCISFIGGSELILADRAVFLIYIAL